MDEQNADIDRTLGAIRNLEPDEFEHLISDLWEYIGYDTNVTKSTGDKGIDIVATRDFPYEEKVLIQAKRHSSGTTVSGPVMQKYGRLSGKHDVDTVIVISSGGFTKQAKEVAREENIKYVNGKELIHLFLREDALQIANQYIESGSADIQPKRSPTAPSEVQESLNRAVGEGEHLEIEFVGYENKKLNYGYEGEGVAQKKCTVLCLHVKNKSSCTWNFRPSQGLSINSVEGFSYTNPQTHSSSKYSNQLTPWNNGFLHDINPTAKSRIALIYRDWFEPESLHYTAELLHRYENDDVNDGKEQISLHLDSALRSKLNSLPDSLPIDSAYFNE